MKNSGLFRLLVLFADSGLADFSDYATVAGCSDRHGISY